MLFLHHSSPSSEQIISIKHEGEMPEFEWAIRGIASVALHPLDHKPRLPRHMAQSGFTGIIISEVVQLAAVARHQIQHEA